MSTFHPEGPYDVQRVQNYQSPPSPHLLQSYIENIQHLRRTTTQML